MISSFNLNAREHSNHSPPQGQLNVGCKTHTPSTEQCPGSALRAEKNRNRRKRRAWDHGELFAGAALVCMLFYSMGLTQTCPLEPSRRCSKDLLLSWGFGDLLEDVQKAFSCTKDFLEYIQEDLLLLWCSWRTPGGHSEGLHLP